MFRRKTLITMIGLSFIATPAWAAEGGGFPWVDWVFSIVNLAVFLGIIFYWAGPKIQNYFAKRRETLLSSLDEAKELRERAERKLEEYSARLDQLEEERKELLDQYHEQGEREKNQIVEDAKRRVEKMRQDAELIIEQEVRRAVASIEKQAVDLAIEMARDRLSERMDDAKRNVLVDRYADELKEMRT